MASVAGYSILNDISARDWVPEEERSYFGLDWVMLKGFDGAAPMGPFITPADFVQAPQVLTLTLTVNGQVKQHSNLGMSSHLLVLPSPSLTGQAVSLPGDSVSGIVEHFLDLRQGHDLGVVVDVDSLRRDIDLDLAHTFQFANCSLDRVLAMLTRNIGGDQCRRFHET